MLGDDEFKDMGENLPTDGSSKVESETQDVQERTTDASSTSTNNNNDTVEGAITNNSADSAVTVQPVQFASFEDLDQVQGPQNQNLNILLDVKLQLTVELGRTDLPIKKVLELTKGSIVTLNKAAGEPVELFANGKLIAYGEVVVIEDNFGLRITHITDPAKRLNSLNPNNKEES